MDITHKTEELPTTKEYKEERGAFVQKREWRKELTDIFGFTTLYLLSEDNVKYIHTDNHGFKLRPP